MFYLIQYEKYCFNFNCDFWREFPNSVRFLSSNTKKKMFTQYKNQLLSISILCLTLVNFYLLEILFGQPSMLLKKDKLLAGSSQRNKYTCLALNKIV
jgi:hypothetical protein